MYNLDPRVQGPSAFLLSAYSQGRPSGLGDFGGKASLLVIVLKNCCFLITMVKSINDLMLPSIT